MKHPIFFLSLLPVIVFLLATSALADERKVITSVAVKQEYTDNLYWSSHSKTDDFISTVSPGLEWIDNTERLRTRLKMQLEGLYYWDNQELNTVDQDYSGALRYAMSSRANVFTSAGYRRDSTIDRDFTETGLLLGRNVTRDRYSYQLGGDYALSEMTNVQLQYDFNKEVYDSSIHSDDTAHAVNLLLSRDISALISRTIGRINLGATRYEFETSKVNSYTGTVGAEWSLNERFSFFGDVGIGYTHSTFDSYHLVPLGFGGFYLVEPYEGNANDTSWTGKAGMIYKGELTDGKVYFSRDVTSASGRDGVVERTALQGSIGRRLNETSRVALSSGYVINKGSQSQQGAADIDETSLWLQPSLTYKLTDRIAVESSYSYSWIHYELTDTDVQRNLVMVQLIFNYPILE